MNPRRAAPNATAHGSRPPFRFLSAVSGATWRTGTSLSAVSGATWRAE